MDEACRKTSVGPSMGGFTWALAVWMWSWLPVGRPERDRALPWEFVLQPFGQWAEDEDLSRHPTIVYFWDNVKIFGGKSKKLYKSFINELDALCWNQVIWQSYVEDAGEEFRLNSMCRRDEHLWRIRCPLICIFAIEWHLPHRVAKQFNVRQSIPPDDVYTGGLALHQINRQTYNHIVDWTHKHQTYVNMWNNRENMKETDMVVSTNATIEAYLNWYESGAQQDYFRWRTRTQTRPQSMIYEEALRDTMKKIMRHCRKIVGVLGCSSSKAADVYAPSTSYHLGTSSHGPGASSHAAGTSSHAAGTSRHVAGTSGHTAAYEDTEDDYQDSDGDYVDEADADYEDEISVSKMPDGPPVSQPSQRMTRGPHKDPWSPSPFQRERPPRGARRPNDVRSKKNEDRVGKSGRK